MNLSKVGDFSPVVTKPTTSPSISTSYPPLTIPFPVNSNATSFLAFPLSFNALRLSFPIKSSLSNLTNIDNPASKGGISSLISCP